MILPDTAPVLLRSRTNQSAFWILILVSKNTFVLNNFIINLINTEMVMLICKVSTGLALSKMEKKNYWERRQKSEKVAESIQKKGMGEKGISGGGGTLMCGHNT